MATARPGQAGGNGSTSAGDDRASNQGRRIMNLFHDRRTDRLILRQETHPIVAALALVFALACFAASIFILRADNDVVAWLFAGFMVAGGLYLVWNSVLLMTEIVATFDGAARTLSIRRRRPWQATSHDVGFDKVAHVEAMDRNRWTGRGIALARETYYGIEIALADDRRYWMSETTESECRDMARQIMTMIRRPAERPA
jgi:hypothetical protein